MSKATSHQAPGYHTVTPYITVNGGTKALDFYTQAFGATELFRMEGPPGNIAHAEFQIGDSRIMISDEFPEMDAKSPKSYGGSPTKLMLYVEDVDAFVALAVKRGATLKREIKDQFYGDRSGSILDPFGHEWFIATHKEDLTPEEINERAAKAHG